MHDAKRFERHEWSIQYYLIAKSNLGVLYSMEDDLLRILLPVLIREIAVLTDCGLSFHRPAILRAPRC